MKYLNEKIESKCPICGCKNAKILYKITAKEVTKRFILACKYPDKNKELEQVIKNLWEQNTCQVLQCDECNFCYSFPYIAGDEDFYKMAYWDTAEGSYPKEKWEYTQTLKAIKKINNKNSLLEVGAGDGAFSRTLFDIINPKNIVCTEYSEYGKKQIEQMGIECWNKDLRDIKTDKKFDIVCLFQIIEHLDRTDDLFKKLLSITSENANIFIAVPNNLFIEFSEKNGSLLDMPPNHIGRYNKKCFEIIATKYNLEIADYKIEDCSYQYAKNMFLGHRKLRNRQKYNSDKIPYWAKPIEKFNRLIAIIKLKKQYKQIGPSQWVHFIKK